MNAIKTLAKLHNWNVPTVCPICGGELELSENHCQLKCVNDFCQSKTAGRINKWTGILDVKEFGLRTINLLIDNGIVDSIYSRLERLSNGVHVYAYASYNRVCRLVLNDKQRSCRWRVNRSRCGCYGVGIAYFDCVHFLERQIDGEHHHGWFKTIS